MDFFTLLALMLVGHALADYPLQGDFLARGKSHRSPIEGVPWYHPLMAHAAIHGGFVGVITQSLFLGIAEFCLHIVIDYGKCDKWFGYNTDQILHVLCKIAWALLAVFVITT